MKDTVPNQSRHFQMDDAYRVARGESTKICGQCWREEVHSYQSVTLASFVIYMILTLGIFWFVWPSRCVCCGTKRYA